MSLGSSLGLGVAHLGRVGNHFGRDDQLHLLPNRGNGSSGRLSAFRCMEERQAKGQQLFRGGPGVMAGVMAGLATQIPTSDRQCIDSVPGERGMILALHHMRHPMSQHPSDQSHCCLRCRKPSYIERATARTDQRQEAGMLKT